MASEHTPGPWRWEFSGTAGRWGLFSDAGPVQTGGPPSINPTQGDMGFIVRAVNAYDDMLAALKAADEAIAEYIRYLDGGEMRGSYDGRPERNGLRKAGYATRAVIARAESREGSQ